VSIGKLKPELHPASSSHDADGLKPPVQRV